jgi:hypothetical protein
LTLFFPGGPSFNVPSEFSTEDITFSAMVAVQYYTAYNKCITLVGVYVNNAKQSELSNKNANMHGIYTNLSNYIHIPGCTDFLGH